MRAASQSLARRALCTALSLAFLLPPNALLLAQQPPDEPVGGPLGAQADPVLDLTVLDALDVDATTGALTLQRDDLTLGEGPAAFTVRRTYRPFSGDALNLGLHWVSSLDLHLDLSVDGDKAAFQTEDGQTIRFRRDAEGGWTALDGRPAWVRSARAGYVLGGLGDEARYLFDREGWLRARRSPGVELTYVYDDAQRLREVRGPWGSLRIERDAGGALTALVAPGRTIRYQRNEQGQLVRVEREGAYETYAYDVYGRLAQVADGQAHIAWDSLGRVLSIAGPRLHPQRLTYLASDDPEAALQVTRTRGGKTERIEVSADGRRIHRWAPDAERASLVVLDERDRLVQFVDASGQETRFRYDARGRLQERSDTSGTSHYTYGSDATDRPTRMELADGRRVDMAYDEEGRLVRVAPAGQPQTSIAWEGARIVRLTDGRGNETSFTYDAHGLVSQVHDDRGLTRYRRDQAGRVVGLEAPNGRVVDVERDALGRIRKVGDALGTILEVERDERGRVIRRRDELGRSYHYSWSPRGDLLRVSDALGTLQAYEYDEAGQVVAMLDGAGNRTAVSHPDARTTVVDDPSFGQRTLRYDELGRLVQEQRGTAEIDYSYDALGRMVGRSTPAGEETFRYDAAGHLLRMQGPAGGYAMEYDALGRTVALENLTLGKRVEYGYDALGDRSEMRMPWGTLKYEYDGQGRVSAIVLPHDQGRVELGYDAEGRRTEVRYPNGTVTRSSYERGQLTQVVTLRDEQVVDRRAYGYDARGRLAWSEDLQGRTEYEHDARGQLTSESGPDGTRTFSYDGAGNRVAVTVDGEGAPTEVAAGNRLVRCGERELSYGQDGTLTGIREGEQTTHLKYDQDGKLVQVQRPDGTVVRYGYAPNGTRLWREQGEQRTDYLHDKADVVGEYVDGQLDTSFVHGPKMDDVLAAVHQDGAYFFHSDLLGSVTAITDAQGAVAARYRYDAFGGDLGAEGQAVAWNPYRYTGRTWDATTRLYDYRARSYDPSLGRFTSPDPLGKLGGDNLYAYVLNDPTQFTDPTGLKGWWQRLKDFGSDALNVTGDALSWVGDKALVVGKATVQGTVNVVTHPLAFGKGLFNGTWGAVKGLGTMIIHPVQTVKGIAYALDHLDETKEALGNKWHEFTDALWNDPEHFSEMMGELTADVALSVVGTKGLDKLAKVAKLGKLAGTVARVGGPVTRWAGAAGAKLATKFPRIANAVRTAGTWSAQRSALLAARTTELKELGMFARTGRRLAYLGGDLAKAGKMAVRAPGAFALYTGTRMTVASAQLVGSMAQGTWKTGKWFGIPILLTMQDQITDSLDRYASHEDALSGVNGAARSFLLDAPGMDRATLERRLGEVGQVYKDYRNQLFRPVRAEDERLKADLAELDAKVAKGEVADDAIDARIAALFSDYSSRRLNHITAIYTRGTEAEHDMFSPSPNRLLAFQDEIELYKAALDKVKDPEARKLLEQKIADTEALMAYENQLFRQGEHDALLAGVAAPPEDFMAPADETGRLQSLIAPGSQSEGR